MKQFNVDEIVPFLDYLCEVSVQDYHEGFYEHSHDNQYGGYWCRPKSVTFNNEVCVFFGGEVKFCSMEQSFHYKNLYFRAIHTFDTQHIRIAFAPNEHLLFDECWCIELPISIYSFIYKTQKL